MRLDELIPDVDVLVLMSPEELGAAIIEVLAACKDMTAIGAVYSEAFDRHERHGYPQARRAEVWQAIAEAWSWLEAQSLIVWPDDGGRNGFRCLSRRAREIGGRKGMEAYRKASLLPKQLLHPDIVEAALIDFQRGDYPSAVFKAFLRRETLPG